MQRMVLAWFILANLFSFVMTFADLNFPWLPESQNTEQQERITEVGIMTQSALGGAGGSYAGLLLTKRLNTADDVYLRLTMYLLMGQNALGYLLALALVWRFRTGNTRRISDSGDHIRAESSSGSGGFREASA